jgi:two-component sensor histidine kinase
MDSILAMRSLAERNIVPTDLVAEANHQVANSLSVLVSMVRMQSAAVK